MSGMYYTIQESPFGQAVRFLTRRKYFKYPEELPGFQIPWQKVLTDEKENEVNNTPTTNTISSDAERDRQNVEALRHISTAASENTAGLEAKPTISRSVTREQSLPWTAERLRIEEQEMAMQAQSMVIMPTKTADGIIIVSWYTTDDPANPLNWSTSKKTWLSFVIFIYTFAVYCASSIYVPSEPGIIRRFNVSTVKASLGLSLYVIGYGIGPLIFSPLSEVPIIGRNVPYVISIILFVILAVPTALVENYAGLLVLRGLTGFMGSPALATGGASMTDIYTIVKLPYGLLAWTGAAFCAPALGPLLSGFAVMKENWRWSLWEILWMSTPVAIVMIFFMPETSAGNILIRRADRLRKLTGNPMYKSQSEIDQGTKKFKDIAIEQLVKPVEITIKDPAVGFTAVYACCIYGIYYSFFEVFPLVYIDIYGFNLGELGITFLTIIIGSVIGVAIFVAYTYYYLEPDIKAHGLRAQEHRLVPALFAVVLLPVSLFWFGWTAEKSIHWIVCTIGLTLFPLGAFILFQCIFMYLPLTYPQYAASLFAASDFCRSSLAAGAIIFAHPLYINLGIGRGVSVLAGLLCGGCVGIWVLYYYGARLRARSKFAAS